MQFRFALAMACVAGILGLSAGEYSVAQTPHSSPKSCNYSGGTSCPPAAPDISPWAYLTSSPALYGNPSFNSVGDLESAWTAYFNSNQICTINYGTAVDGGSDTISYGEVVSQPYMNLTDSITYYTSSTPACSHNGSGNLSYRQTRSVSCTAPTSINYTSSPIVGPYCSSPGSPTQYPFKVGPSCPSGCATAGAADSNTSQTTQSGPVNASNGSKFEVATDYAGVGSDPIIFTRTYNSASAYQYWYNGQPATPMQYLGVGWTASFFQYLLPVSVTDSHTTYNTVYAYRPDGRVLIFNQSGSTYSPDGDVADSLAPVSGGGWQYQTANDTIETYNAAGQLISIAARGKSPITVSYNTGSGLGDGPTSVSDAFGHSLAFAYSNDPGGKPRLSTVTDPAGKTIQYAYNSYGDLTNLTNADTTTQSYAYSSGVAGGLYLLTGHTDEAAVQYASWTYSSSGGHPITSQLAGGVGAYSFTYSTSGSGGSISITDPLGQARTFNQSLVWGSYRTTSASAVCPGCGEDASRVFDANGNVTKRVDFDGNETTYSYDVTQNEETSRTEGLTSTGGTTAQTRTITTSWDPNWRQPQVISVYAGATGTGTPLRITTLAYDGDSGISCGGGGAGALCSKTVTDTSVTPNVTRTWSYTYDTYGRMRTAKGPRTDVNSTTTYTYYTCTTGSQCGQLYTVTDPVGNVTTYNTYNAHGQPLTITDPNGVLTTLTYDLRLRLTSRQVGTELTQFSYWPTGLLKQVTLPDSSYVMYTYDNAHRLYQINDGLGNKIVYTLDNMGNRTGENSYDPSNALHRTHTRMFNVLNQLYKDINAANTAAVTTTYGYDNNNNQTSIAAPLARNTTNYYDPLNRLSQILDPGSGNTYFGYDANDNLLSVKDPKALTTNYTYNGFGDLTTQVSPDTGTTTNSYDSGGNLATATDARSALGTYTYDAANRVMKIVYSKGGTSDQTLTFGYDTGTYGKGRLTSASDANHSVSWTYDFMGRVTGKALVVGSFNKSIGYGFTNADLTSVVTPSGQGITYGYNANHQIMSVAVNGTTVISAVTYEPFGGVNGWTWGNGTTVSRTYNGDGLVSQIVTAGATLGYTFDNANRIQGISDSSNSALTWTYGYDLLDRLSTATTSAINDGWTYDANGNRLTQTGSTAVTYAVSSTSNQLTATSGGLVRTYTYDAAGDVTSNGTSFVYNDRGRMAS
ncbi:MAG: RHS repeat protein, partial [Proteobacteria bacterium]|nr:RHS repeat protein [Pseudomonadota bacterium]